MQRIGFIDWTDKNLSLHVFKKSRNHYALMDTISVTLEDELNQSSLTPLARTDFEHIYLSVPANLLSLRELDFPFSDKNKMNDTIPYELEGILLGNTSDYSIDYLIRESSASGSRVLVVCIEKTKLRDIINIFSSAGLEPAVITSIDIRLSSKNIETILKSSTPGKEIRTEAVREELINPLINLRQEELAYKGDIERIRKSLRLTGMLVIFLLLILCVDTTMKFISLKKENASLTKETNTIYRDVFPEDAKIVDAVRQFKGNLNSLMEKKTMLGGMPVLDTMLDIANLKNKNTTLGEFSVDEETILIKGTALSFEDVDSLKNTLSSSFTDVRIIDSKSSPDKKISFSIIMKEKRHGT